MMGKALVKMLTKFDRPYCRDLAYQVADAIIRQDKTGTTERNQDGPVPIPSHESREFVDHLRRAIDISRTSLDDRDSAGRTLIEHAQHKNKDEVVAILQQLEAA